MNELIIRALRTKLELEYSSRYSSPSEFLWKYKFDFDAIYSVYTEYGGFGQKQVFFNIPNIPYLFRI